MHLCFIKFIQRTSVSRKVLAPKQLHVCSLYKVRNSVFGMATRYDAGIESSLGARFSTP